MLDSEEQPASTTPGSARERAQVPSRGADPSDGLPVIEVYKV